MYDGVVMKFFSGCCLILTRLNVSDASKITCLDKLGVLLKFNRYQESVVVYVDTTKIQIYVYQFLVSRNGRSTKLNSQFVREVTPGLAHYKNKWSMVCSYTQNCVYKYTKNMYKTIH